MKRIFIILSFLLLWSSVLQSQSRIKDIVSYEGVRDNMLVGYGLVVGLNGTGDSLNSSVFTRESIIGMLERLGVSASSTSLNTKNTAAVMVTATLPAFAKNGNRIDVSVSSLGDSSSLMGGTLLVTPLLGADGSVYAVSQGGLAVGGFTAGGNNVTVTKGVPTSARIVNGAIIEKEIGFKFSDMKSVKLSLNNPDFTTARRIAQAINSFLGYKVAVVEDSSTVNLNNLSDINANLVDLLTDIEQIRIQPDQTARIVIDEQSGVIVMGENVRISTVAVAQGNLTVNISELLNATQALPFTNVGEQAITETTEVIIDEGADKKLGIIEKSVSLSDLVIGLNSLGVGPRDMITILQAIKASGALQAEIDVM